MELDEAVILKLAHTACAVINPMAAMFGGMVGQEVVKAVSGKFHPLHQWFYFDSVESMPAEFPLPASELELKGTRYDHQIICFGKSYVPPPPFSLLSPHPPPSPLTHHIPTYTHTCEDNRENSR